MGNGIAHVFAQAGYQVRLVDIKPEILDKARATIDRNLERQVTKGKLSAEDKKTFGTIFQEAAVRATVTRILASPHVLLLGLGVGVLSSAIPYGIDQTVLRRISMRRFAVLQALLPVVATIIGVVALDQRPSGLEAVGIALVVAGVATQDRS